MLNKKTIIVLILGAVVTLSSGIALAASKYMTPAVPGEDTIVSGCVIRFSNPDGTPSIHANGAHMCAGVNSVRIDPKSGWIEVDQKVRGASKNVILFAQCQTDETLGGRRGIVCGASGGTDNTSFALHDTRINRMLDLRKASDRARVQGKNSNLWVGWFHVPNGWDR